MKINSVGFDKWRNGWMNAVFRTGLSISLKQQDQIVLPQTCNSIFMRRFRPYFSSCTHQSRRGNGKRYSFWHIDGQEVR